jgi:hypothetical protein
MVYIDLPTADRVVVIGDLHGDISTLCSCLYMTNIINSNLEWIAQPSNTIVVQIGDQVDSLSRNEVNQNWEKISDYSLIKFTDRIDEIAKKKGGRFISLIGNHEIMNVLNCFEYVSELSMRKSGGHYGRSKKFSPGGELAKILAKRPVIQKIGPLLFCHAGLLPHHLNVVNSNIGYINSLMNKYLMGVQLSDAEKKILVVLFLDDNSILWNRKYLTNINDPDSKNLLNYVLHKTNSKHMIIGHNSLQHITSLYDMKLWITDVGLSRAFPNNSIEVLEILNGGEPSLKNDFKPFRAIKANT